MNTNATTTTTNTGGNHYPIASLYVGDLAPDVTEAVLFEKFSTAGPVLSIRVCRDIITRRSLGYAYVNYQNAADADRAIDTLNFEKLNGRPIRIMWSQRDPSLRRSGLGNIFIKNLEKTVDNKIMFDTFSVFGNILSCKVSYDEKSQSKGYGFVHFDSEEAATKAITLMNGKIIEGKKVFCGKFVSRKDRDTGVGPGRRFTNVYVKNLPEDISDEKLKEIFSQDDQYPISSAVIMRDNDKSKGFGFVCFQRPDGAEEAVKAFNNVDFFKNGKPLYVGRAQKKAEREAELKRKLEMMKAERINRSQGVNLYVKNLEDSVTDEKLQNAFCAYGTITSAKVMVDEKGQSKGFGFVCFSTPEEATKAVTEMNNRIIVSKPLYVALAQRKEDREAQKLNLRYGTTGVRMPSMPPQGMMPPQGVPQQFQPGPGMPVGPGGQLGHVAMQPGLHQQQYLMPIAPSAALHRGYAPYQQAGQVPPQPGSQGMRMNRQWNQMNQINRAGGPGYNYRGNQVNPRMNPAVAGQPGINRQNVAAGQVAGVAGPQPGARQFVQPNVQGVPAGAMPQPNRGGVPGGRGPNPNVARGPKGQGAPQQFGGILSEQASVSHEDQLQMLGEQLFPKVQSFNNEYAGKITGMLLEMDVQEIVHLLDSPDLLKAKVEEGLAVLKAHATGARGDSN